MNRKEKFFEEAGNWYKGNLHAHTTNSDGSWTPEQSVKEYAEMGYSFLCLSEHDYYTDLREELESDSLILLPGLEGSVCLADTSKTSIDVAAFTGGTGYRDMYRTELVKLFRENPGIRMAKTHHIHGILGNEAMRKAAGRRCFRENEQTLVRVYFNEWNGVKAAQEMVDHFRSRGCFVTYNHPIWSRVEMADVQGLKDIWAIEIYNYATVNECGEGEDTVFWESMLRRGIPVQAFASDDNHNGGTYPESFGGYLWVQAEELSHEAIVNSLLEGKYYASSGAMITQWGIRENKVYVESPRAKKMDFIFGGRVGASRSVCLSKKLSTAYAECPMRGDETYVRIEVTDWDGNRAWTNAVML